MDDISKYAENLFKKIQKQSGKATGDDGEEYIHALRVEVKKLKALFYLLSFYFPELEEKQLKKLTKVFHSAGRVREWQLLTGQVRGSSLSVEPKEEIIQFARHAKEKAFKKFRHEVDKSGSAAVKELRETVLRFTDRMNQQELSGYFHKMISSIEKKWKKKNLSVKSYHEVRREMKDLKFNLKLLDENTKKSLKRFSDSAFLDECEELLGKWHDAVVAAEQLQDLTGKEQLSEDTRNQLVPLQKSKLAEADAWLVKFRNVGLSF
jgi:CHAD domain-containing protein